MKWLLFLLQITVLLHIFIQDRKEREVYLFSYLILAILLFINAIQEAFFYFDMAINAAITVLLITAMYGYLVLKEGKLINPFSSYFGLGDVLFILCLAIGLSPFHFIFFLVVGSISILLFYHFKKLWFNKANENIPLAGDLALLLCVYSGLQFFGFINSNSLFL